MTEVPLGLSDFSSQLERKDMDGTERGRYGKGLIFPLPLFPGGSWHGMHDHTGRMILLIFSSTADTSHDENGGSENV